MEANQRSYSHIDSAKRMDGYLDGSGEAYKEVNEIPARSELTYTNGFYVQHCAALFIDIRRSSELPDKYTRPRLAKIYRSYISEAVAIINANANCAEVNIVGDSVYGIFNVPYKKDIDSVFDSAACLQSMVNILNYKLRKRDIDPIRCGIGIDYGRLLMIQAGFSGSGLNDVVWIGNAVNKASHLCHYGGREWYDKPIMVSSVIYSNLNEHNQALLEYSSYRNCYHGNVVNTVMNDWLKAQP